MKVYAVMADVEKKEHYVESFITNKRYKEALDDNSPNREMQSVFSTFKEAETEAKRLSRACYARNWTYNKERNCEEEFEKRRDCND